MKKIAIILTVLALACAPASAQGNILQRLGNRAKNAAQQNIGNKVEQGINDILNGNEGKGNNNQQQQQQQQQPARQQSARQRANNQTTPAAPAGTSEPAGRAVPGAVPNPYTTFDIPDNPFDVSLGLPQNDKSGERPSLVKPSGRVSYAAYYYPDTGPRSKEFWNAERQRMYSVSFERFNGEDRVNRMLAIVDSMAVYMIDDAKKLITKIPLSAVEAAAMHDVVSIDTIIDEHDVSSSQGRWCYAHRAATETTLDIAGHAVTDTYGDTTYIDLETGITLEISHGFAHEYTRNIHLGVFYPEIFDLPAGYRMIVQDFSKGLQQMDALEAGMMQTEERLKEMNLENMSFEELMQMAK